MSRSRIFFFTLFSFVLGIGFGSLINFQFEHLFLFSFVTLFLLVLDYKNRNVMAFCICAAVFLFGFWMVRQAIMQTERLKFLGSTIDGEVTMLASSQTASSQRVVFEDAERKIKIAANIAQYPAYEYGIVAHVSDCMLEKVENKNEQIDYRMLMAKDGVVYTCKKPHITYVSDTGGNVLLRNILAARNSIEKNLTKLLPEPEATLAVGILLGGSGGFSKEMQNAFSRTGMTHVVAVSGYNVSIIVQYLLLAGIGIGLWRKQAIWFALFGIIAFVLMAGSPASAVRAAVMGAIILWAMGCGRLSNSANALLLTAAIMLLFNPLLLRWDIGFELSFFATLGIILIYPLLENQLIEKNKLFGIVEAVTLTLSAQVLVLPIILINFKTISIISVLANVLVLPLIPLAMLLVFLAVLAGFVFQPLAFLFAYVAYVPLYLCIECIKLLSDLSFASVQIEGVGYGLVCLYYCLVGLLFYAYKKYAPPKTDS